jgi:hypothetical protein
LDAIDPLTAFLKRGDLVFIKGSLSSNMQAVAKALLAEVSGQQQPQKNYSP